MEQRENLLKAKKITLLQAVIKIKYENRIKTNLKLSLSLFFLNSSGIAVFLYETMSLSCRKNNKKGL